MNDTTSVHEIIRVAFDRSKPSLIFETDWIVLLIIIAIILLVYFLRKKFKWFGWHEMEVEISGSPKMTFKVERNYDNLFIANRIYIELTTRKAALPIDENQDNFEEIYDSWYKLFGIIRDEVKALPGKYLKNHDPTTALMGLTRKILNQALRPHLTEHQAKFRKWLETAKEEPANKNLSPQELQRKYPDFQNLVQSMKAVNQTLASYANELDKLIKG
ncbi:MAG TPA: hypothetical protein VKC90_09585 [Chitinophagaceae bacterium]|nr:hypothetical protein [Chitinophagaceae bacterium]